MTSPAALPFSPSMLARLDRPGPRYTSYPTADRFVEAFTPVQYARALTQRASGVGGAGPLSLYVHIPFCESVCYYCACNKVVTRHHERAREYLDALATEIRLHVGLLGTRQRVAQLHLGGGTPTFLSDGELSRLVALLHEHFVIDPGAECSIEVDPRTADAQRLAHLHRLGFNRLSLGVQDTDSAVQQAVHRVQSLESVRSLIVAARTLGFASINVDLIYGLPRQTPESFALTVAQVGALRPDRIALYAYAHLPARFKAQRRIDGALLPLPSARMRMLGEAISGFLARGYSHIGMDHFALPDDALALAKRQGRLQRNFQGYSTQPDGDLIGLGVSAIGRLGASYAQNAKTLPEYYDALRQGQFATQRGLTCTRDDLLRRAVIMALMCHGRVELEAIEIAYLVNFRRYFAAELADLRELAAEGLVTLDDEAIALTPAGWFAVRAVAMVFDRLLRADQRRERYSRVI
jgi:oxygen-independent coproporphyrinogen-3 oxidase